MRILYTDIAGKESSRQDPQDNTGPAQNQAQTLAEDSLKPAKIGASQLPGQEAHTKKLGEPEASVEDSTASDRRLLAELVGDETTDQLFGLHEKITQDPKAKAQSHGVVKINAIEDKQTRSRVHSVSSPECVMPSQSLTLSRRSAVSLAARSTRQLEMKTLSRRPRPVVEASVGRTATAHAGHARTTHSIKANSCTSPCTKRTERPWTP